MSLDEEPVSLFQDFARDHPPCCDSAATAFALGITEYLPNGGKLEVAQQTANHERSRTTGTLRQELDQISLDEVERILI